MCNFLEYKGNFLTLVRLGCDFLLFSKPFADYGFTCPIDLFNAAIAAGL